MNIMNNATSATTEQTAEGFAVHTSPEAAGMTATAEQKTIVCRFRNPSRVIAVNIPATAWTALNSAVTDATYNAILSGVLTSAAQSIISRYYMNTFDAHRITVSSIPAALLTTDEIMSEAAGNNSDWLTKEELTEAWKSSATRAAIYSADKYTSNPAYRKAYTAFEEMILKLAGKTSAYTPDQLDVILAKVADADLSTPFGAFIVKRVEALKNKPTQSAVDFDAL